MTKQEKFAHSSVLAIDQLCRATLLILCFFILLAATVMSFHQAHYDVKRTSGWSRFRTLFLKIFLPSHFDRGSVQCCPCSASVQSFIESLRGRIINSPSHSSRIVSWTLSSTQDLRHKQVYVVTMEINFLRNKTFWISSTEYGARLLAVSYFVFIWSQSMYC